MTMTGPAAGWYRDPMSRHEYRYWDGAAWTEHVSDRGVVGNDLVGSAPPVAPVMFPAGYASSTVPAAPGAVVTAVPTPIVLPYAAPARRAVATTPTFTVGAVVAALGVGTYVAVGALSVSLGTRTASGLRSADTTFAIGTKGGPYVTMVYTAGVLLPVLAFALLFVFPTAYRLSAAARAQWGGGGFHRWAPWVRNYRAYLRQHLGTSTLYKGSFVGRLIASTVGAAALAGLAILNVASASNQGFDLEFGAYGLIGGGALALAGLGIAWLGERRVVHVDELGRLLDA